MATTTNDLDLGRYKLGWSDVEDFYVYKPKKGLTQETAGVLYIDPSLGQ